MPADDRTGDSPEREPGPVARIDWPATMAGAAAAVTVAVLLSTLGAAGTLIGAALGSVIATVSSALYKQGIESSRRRMVQVQAAAWSRMAQQQMADQVELDTDGSGQRAVVPTPDPEPAPATDDDALAAATRELSLTDTERWRDLPWRRIAVPTAGVFVVAVLVISAIELIAGRSVSTITGGNDDDRTSITGIFGDKTDDSTDDREPDPEPSDSSTEPTDGVSTDPTDQPTESPSETASDGTTPSASTSSTATADPSESGQPTEPTGTGIVSPAPTDQPTQP